MAKEQDKPLTDAQMRALLKDNQEPFPHAEFARELDVDDHGMKIERQEPTETYSTPDEAARAGRTGGGDEGFTGDTQLRLLEEMATNMQEMLGLIADIHSVMTQE